MIKFDNYIGGQWLSPQQGHYLPVINPATGAVYAQVAASTAEDTLSAINAAQHAFPEWSRWSNEDRFAIMMRLADLLEARSAELALAETTDTGKPLSLAQSVDIPRAIRNTRFFASAVLHVSSESYQQEPAAWHYVLRQPLGTVAVISPWNLPLYLLTWKLAPALATGNCVVAKPSEITPYTAHLLGEVAQQAGLPPGVLNILHGSGPALGKTLTTHPHIKAISFTGSTQTGRILAQGAAPHFKKISLEMGGKNAALVFADCDYENMLNTLVQAAFSNQGQICLCASRILIAESIYDRFRADFVERVQALVVADPMLPETQQGAVISAAHQAKIMGYIAQAIALGGTIWCGGTVLKMPGRCQNGFFIAPTVIDGLEPMCALNQEEIFGPVVTLQPFEDEARALALANHTPYGLAATVWTRDLAKAHRMAAQLDAGLVWINSWMQRDLRVPFGGMKQSGLGREGGWDAWRFFTEAKSVGVANA